jgi:hypothetical protein
MGFTPALPLDRSPAGASVAAIRCSVQAIFSFKFGIAGIAVISLDTNSILPLSFKRRKFF